MLFETLKDDIIDSRSIIRSGKKRKAGQESMSLILIRQFDIKYKGERHPVLMVRIDNAGTRLFAIPNTEQKTDTGVQEPLKWVAERWVEEVLPYDIKP